MAVNNQYADKYFIIKARQALRNDVLKRVKATSWKVR